jgi:hypothetical protein
LYQRANSSQLIREMESIKVENKLPHERKN